MDRNLSDEQLDRLAKTLLRDFAPDENEIAEIADSPRLRWNVRRAIEAEKARRARRWFAGWRAAAPVFGALAVVLCVGLAILLTSSRRAANPTVAQNPVQNLTGEFAAAPEIPASVSPTAAPETPAAPEKNAPVRSAPKNFKTTARPVGRIQTVAKTARQTAGSAEIPPRAAVEETKTGFIALSYAGVTDSGQVVRVKVPSSMMVSLGVKSNVENESSMVSAEVVIGDDGLARAIRFIR